MVLLSLPYVDFNYNGEFFFVNLFIENYSKRGTMRMTLIEQNKSYTHIPNPRSTNNEFVSLLSLLITPSCKIRTGETIYLQKYN